MKESKDGPKMAYGIPKKEVAKAIGVSEATLIRAEQHVAAVEDYPDLAAAPQPPEQADERDISYPPSRSRPRSGAYNANLRHRGACGCGAGWDGGRQCRPYVSRTACSTIDEYQEVCLFCRQWVCSSRQVSRGISLLCEELVCISR